jgi:hypothetical protein
VRFVALAALAACTNFQTITPGICGNGVLDEGEDCDNPKDSSCIACSVACTKNDDCRMNLPPGRDATAYQCGWDQPTRLCHAPGGKFGGLAGAQPFDVLGFGVVDVNGDGIGDAVGLSQTQVITRFGDASGQLASVAQAVMPSLLGPPAVLDVTGDGAIDVVLPTRDGLVAYTGANGAMVPYTFALRFEGGQQGIVQALDTIKIDTTYVAVFFQQGSRLTLGLLNTTVGAQGAGMPNTLQVCDDMLDPTAFHASSVSVFDVSAVYGKPAIELAFESPRADTTLEVCAMTIVESAPSSGSFTVTAVTPAGAVAGNGAVVLAELDPAALGCPSLVLANQTRYAGIKASGCQLATSTSALPFPPMTHLVGRVPLVPAIGSYANDALVFDQGIAAYDPSGNQLSMLYTSDLPLALSSFGDFDGDGKVDAVVSPNNTASFDVLYRMTMPMPGFVRLRVGTDSPIKMLMTGDFDGNGRSDVLAVERVTTPTSALDRALIAYGTSDQLLPPIEVGEFYNLDAMCVVQLVDSADQISAVDDVAAIDARPNSTTVLGTLHGTPQRGLIPYFDVRPPGPGSTPPWLTSGFTAVVGGRFADGDPPGSIDLIAVDASFTGYATIYKLAGGGPGTLVAPSMGARSTAQPIKASYCTQPGTGFCANHIVLEPFPAGDRDLVVWIDGFNGTGVVIDPRQLSTTMNVFDVNPTTVMPFPGDVTTTLIADSDGDGVNELIFAYVDRMLGKGGVQSCTITGTTLDCRDLLANVTGVTGLCTGVAIGAVTEQGQLDDPPATPSLVLVCGMMTYRLEYTSSGYQAKPLVGLPFPALTFSLADVTGDLVPDLVIGGTANGARTLFVYPQCTSRGCK